MMLEGIDIAIERTERRKTISVFIERDGSVKVLAPLGVGEEIIEKAIRSKSYQIFTKLARWKELNQGKVNRSFVNGQSFLYFGRNYRLVIVDAQDIPLKVSGGNFLLSKEQLPNAERVFRAFYKEKAEQKIKERLILISERFEKRPTSIKVLELHNRWASWSPKGSLNFHWKCAMASVGVLDYIITHEMVHLIHPNHSPEFWNELDKKMPDYRKHEQWLKLNGVKMSL
jgi:predicted metal-dependent hydrolase